MPGVAGWLKLERAVLHVEVVSQAFAKAVQDPCAAAVG